MRLLAWNVRGGADLRVGDVVAAIRPDLCALIDVRANRYPTLAKALAEGGLTHSTGTNVGGFTGILVAAMRPFVPGRAVNRVEPGRMVHVRIGGQIDLVAVYGPLPMNGISSSVTAFWKALIAEATGLTGGQAIITGDFNSAPYTSDSSGARLLQPTAAKAIASLLDSGWRDVFRPGPASPPLFTYRDPRGEYRIDHVLFSHGMRSPSGTAVVTDCAGYAFCRDRAVDKTPQLTDHAALVIDL